MRRKFLILALAISALISAFAITASAETTETVTEASLNFEAANLAFDDSVYILYAVSHEGIEAADVQLLFWTNPQKSLDAYTIGTESYSKSWIDSDETVNEKSCLIFKNNELRAKNMADYVYARAYAKVGDIEYYSEVNKYSILQYAYNKLGKTGTASTNTALTDMLSSMLAYGADAQAYTGYNTARPADAEFYQIKVEGGALEDGFTKGLYLTTETATLTANEAMEGFAFAGWKNSEGKIVSTDNPLSLTDFNMNETYTSTYEEMVKYSKGLAYTLSDDGTYYIVSGIGTCTDTHIIIPDTYEALPVKEIGSKAFAGNTIITGITISKKIEALGNSAFAGCTAIEKIHFNATSMNDLSSSNNVFYNVGGSVVIGNNVTKIPAYLFSPSTNTRSCKITDVTFEENSICKSIEAEAFRSCISLKSINIPDSVNTIKSNAFMDTGFTEITIPYGITSLYNSAFDSCKSLEKIYFNAHAMNDEGEKNFTFRNAGQNSSGINLVIGKDVTKIPANLFSANGIKITKVDFEDQSICESIGAKAFKGASSLKSITIPSSITSIGSSAFSGIMLIEVYNLSNLKISAGASDNGEIARYALNVYKSLDVPSKQWSTEDGFVFYENDDICYLLGYNGTEPNVTLPENCNGKKYEIYSYAFYKNTTIQNVIIPNNVKAIKNCAFQDSSITSITLPEGINKIGYYSFYGCSNLTDINIPDSVVEIGDSAFEGCVRLKYNEYDNAYYLGNNSNPYLWLIKAKNTSIESCNIHENTKFIYYEAFARCSALVSITLPNNIIGIGTSAFKNCSGLTSIAMPNSIVKIGSLAFYGCSNLISIVIPVSITLVEDQAFNFCNNITSVYYTGAQNEWAKIKIYSGNENLTNAIIYYYSESEPDVEGNFWYRDENGNIVVWG